MNLLLLGTSLRSWSHSGLVFGLGIDVTKFAGPPSLATPSRERTGLGLPRRPLDALQQRAVDTDAESRRQLDQRVDPRDASTALKQTDLGPVK
jgi:hypothetical protein